MVLLERDEQVAVADALVAATTGGEGRVLAVEGVPGIGKTRLLREVRERGAGRGMRVLTARGAELERDIAFGVVRQLVEVPLARMPGQQREQVLAGAAAPIKSIVDSQGAAIDQFQALHGGFWLLANLAEAGPVMVVVDDVQWADQPSLRFLRYLSGRLDELPVLVVLGVRTKEPDPLLAEVLADPVTEVVELAPLSETATGVLLAEAFDQTAVPDFVLACHDATGGNPFLLVELAEELAGRGVAPDAEEAVAVRRANPPAVTRSVAMRLARLPEQARTLAKVLAVLETARFPVAAGLAGLDDAEAAHAADALCAAGLVDRGSPLRFAHPLVRSAVYEDLPAHWRALTHRRAADRLAEAGEGPEEVATHLMLTRPAGDAGTVDRLRAAASASVRRGSPLIAARYLTRAMAEPPEDDQRADVLFDLGLARSSGGLPGGLDDLLDAVSHTADPAARARRSLVVADLLVFAGDIPRAVALLSSAVDGLGDSAPDLRFALRVRRASCTRIDTRVAGQRVEELTELLGQVRADGPAERELLVWSSLDALQHNGLARAGELLDRAVARPGVLAFHPCESHVFGMALLALTYLDRFDELDELVDAARAEIRRTNSILGLALVSLFTAVADLRRGRLAEVDSSASAALAVVPVEAWSYAGPNLLEPMVETLVELGAVDRAERLVAEVERRENPSSQSFVFLRLARGRLFLAQDRAEDALRNFLEAGEQLTGLNIRSPTVAGWRGLAARAHLRLGDHAAAARLAREELALARELAGPVEQGEAMRVAGLAAGDDEGLALLREAVATLSASQARLRLARALVDLGAALRRANRRAASRDPLREGLDLADRLGARPLAERARVELAATGARVRRAQLRGVAALTPSERRVAELAMAGLSNRDIAQRLFVTTKTVEKHLNGAFGKLEISNRAQLAEHLAER